MGSSINRREFLTRGIAALAFSQRQYVAEGDSITYGTGTEPLTSYARILDAQVMAHTGDTIWNWEARAALVDSWFQRGGILSLLPGNDLYTLDYPGGVSDYLNELGGYLDAREHRGWRVILCTTLPRYQPATFDFDAFRLPCNAAMRSWVGVHCDALCDFASVEGITLGDGIHPDNAGQEVMAGKMRSVFDSL